MNTNLYSKNTLYVKSAAETVASTALCRGVALVPRIWRNDSTMQVTDALCSAEAEERKLYVFGQMSLVHIMCSYSSSYSSDK